MRALRWLAGLLPRGHAALFGPSLVERDAALGRRYGAAEREHS